MALAWLVATFAAGWRVDALMAAFPSSLFVTLLGVTLLFGAAERNQTLAALTERAVRACGGRTAALPWLFFLLAGVASASPRCNRRDGARGAARHGDERDDRRCRC
jgi:di/tricarboxylate transporter